MTDKIEKLKEQQAAALAKLEREEKIRAALPIKPDEASVLSGVYGNRVSVRYKAECLADALVILRAFNRVPFSQVKGTFLSHRPAEWFKEGEIERADYITDGCEIMLTISGGKGFGPDAELCQWARLESGEVVQITVTLGVYPCGKGYPHQWHVRSDIEYNKRGEVTEARHDAPEIAADLPAIRWAAGSRDAYRFGWVWLENGTFEQEMERYDRLAKINRALNLLPKAPERRYGFAYLNWLENGAVGFAPERGQYVSEKRAEEIRALVPTEIVWSTNDGQT